MRGTRSGPSLLVLCGFTFVLSSTAFAHPDGGHLAIGDGESNARQALRIQTSDTNLPSRRLGTAWFRPRRGPTVEIALACLELEWRSVSYVPWFLPADAHGHELYASGWGGDGRVYRLYLWVPAAPWGAPAGFTLQRRTASANPCGAPSRTVELRRGSFVISPAVGSGAAGSQAYET